MRRSRLAGFIVLILLLDIATQSIDSRAQIPASTPSKNILWKVTSKENTAFLLGSIHLLKEDAYPLNPAIENAFDHSQKLVLEVDLDAMNSPKAQQAMLAKGLLLGGKTLKDTLSQKTYDRVAERVKALGLSIETVGRLKPWLLTLTLALAKMQELGYNPELGIDKHFFEKARRDNKQVIGLETAEYQFSLLDDMSPAAQEETLLQALEELDFFEKEFDEIIQAWTAGDSIGLEKALLESFRDYPDVYETLVARRNRNWVPKIESLLAGRGTAMVIVGAAHLVGSNGVVELLRKRGYSVEQM